MKRPGTVAQSDVIRELRYRAQTQYQVGRFVRAAPAPLELSADQYRTDLAVVRAWYWFQRNGSLPIPYLVSDLTSRPLQVVVEFHAAWKERTQIGELLQSTVLVKVVE